MITLLDTQTLGLSDYADLAQVIIALINLFFVGYVIIYQSKKDSADKIDKKVSDKASQKLQIFKELILQPNLSNFFVFFDNVASACESLKASGITDIQKGEIVTNVKDHQNLLRKQFIVLLLSVNLDFHKKFSESLDKLVDDITNNVFNPTLDLSIPDVYGINIIDKILETKSNLVGLIMNYDGHESLNSSP